MFYNGALLVSFLHLVSENEAPQVKNYRRPFRLNTEQPVNYCAIIMSKQKVGEVMQKLSKTEVEEMRKKHWDSVQKSRIASVRPALSKDVIRKNRAVGLSLFIGAVGIYLYTMYAVKQEDFLDKELKHSNEY